MTTKACTCGSAIHVHGKNPDLLVALFDRLHRGAGHEPCTAEAARAVRNGARGAARKVHAPTDPPRTGWSLCGGYGDHVTSPDRAAVTCGHCTRILNG